MNETGLDLGLNLNYVSISYILSGFHRIINVEIYKMFDYTRT